MTAQHTPGKNIPGISGYTVTQDGRVFSHESDWRGYGQREMRQHPNADGYPSVRLTTNGVRKRYKVHTLVALTYLEPCPAHCDQLRHLDGDRTNNNLSNLAWGTAKLNAADRDLHNRTSKGKKHSRAVRNGLTRKVFVNE